MDIESEDGEKSKKGFENIVVFQNDPVYQDHWDHARMIVCRYSVDDDFDMKDKRVIFKPIVIDMLDVVSVSCPTPNQSLVFLSLMFEYIRNRFRFKTSAANNRAWIAGWKSRKAAFRKPMKSMAPSKSAHHSHWQSLLKILVNGPMFASKTVTVKQIYSFLPDCDYKLLFLECFAPILSVRRSKGCGN